MPESRKRAILETATVDFDSVGAGATGEEVVAVNGARVGDVVVVNAASAEAGLVVSGFVSDPGEVTIRVANVTGAGVDAAEQDFHIAVIGG